MNEIIKSGQIHSINYCGNEISIDGEYGPESKANGIRCLQVAMNHDYGANLDIDGVFGTASSSAISGHYVEQGETQEMVKAVQIGLMLRGYACDPDGIFGHNTWVAVVDFQKDNGLDTDGVVGQATISKLFDIEIQSGGSGDSGEWTKYDPNNLPNFGPDEFKCKCGCGQDVCDELKQKAQLFRDKIGMPMTITDGFRCPPYNAQEGGTATSLHLEGKAFDMQVFKDGTYHMTDDDQRYYRELAHQCGLTTGNYYGSGGGWMHCQIGRSDYDEWL